MNSSSRQSESAATRWRVHPLGTWTDEKIKDHAKQVKKSGKPPQSKCDICVEAIYRGMLDG